MTPKQIEALRAVEAGEVYQHNCGSAAWRIFGASPTVVGRLTSMGLVRWTKVIGGKAELTDAGRAALGKGGAEG
ncbi:hypothetical protein [Consotaella salsifontis]|uniref:Uncharacterized protein n=1 Tax=Consotaella salsifontis TaxID=1365950 RepID=A0A1T4RW88_9HYPH|nr:hypothetical protein [Consotaella salsifontis]SKA20274.1 hypothetical protein SAMN05428963_10828 [Consotaella salsifontis]